MIVRSQTGVLLLSVLWRGGEDWGSVVTSDQSSTELLHSVDLTQAETTMFTTKLTTHFISKVGRQGEWHL